ncbi:MAG: type I-C CRISPR-associated protein Cas8c/Csd1 [Firmicutes bacterium]|nr:type I-C CRISPR-associated protein Cas8c/Csd1 [Bacillota bacterium]
MSWMTQLYKTYENLQNETDLLKRCPMPLLPLSHTIQAAHVEMLIGADGELLRAYEVPKADAQTIVPCTEDSASRSSGVAPHMLYDNLKYIAGDAYLYDEKKGKKENYEAYCKQLKEWCDYEGCPEDVRTIYKYVLQGTVIEDLIDKAVLTIKNGKLAWNGNTDNKPAGDILGTFVRFRVKRGTGMPAECNENTELMKAYEEFDKSKYTDERLCFVSGVKKPVTYKHSSKIRYGGDSARLVSSNDTSGYTFRGRFHNREEAFAVGYEVSQRVHNALRWLIANQGFITGPQTVITWAVDAREVPKPQDDTAVLFEEDEDLYDSYTTLDTYAESVKKAINGYKHKDLYEPTDANNIVLMIVEGATPGRLSITYYREFSDMDYLDNIEHWHKTCVWNHSYKIKKTVTDQEDGSKKEETKYIKFTGAPSVKDIISAAYGDKIGDGVKKHLTEILVSCIADKRKLPRDIMMKAVERISNPTVLENWEIERCTSITCALIRKYYYDKYKEEYNMALDYENRDRSYLFGRVLAYAERIEEYALFKEGKESRVPSARKLRNKFRMKPARTLVLLDDKLGPYVDSLYVNNGGLYQNMQNVIALIKAEDFMNDTPLEPTYLLGYACQISELKKGKETEK